jgi:tetratricopeptide (TPR) repeat protein
MRDFDQSINLDPQNPMAFHNRGTVKQKLEDYAGAIMDYNMAIQLAPDMANSYFNRALAKEVMKMPGYQTDYAIAAQLNPKFDLEARRLNAEKMAQNQQKNQAQQKQQRVQQQQQAKIDSLTSQPLAAQIPTAPDTSEKEENNNNATDSIPSEDEQKDTRNNRKLNLMIADSRNLPGEEEEMDPDDGRIQNRNIAIDLQPIFVVSAFEKNAVDYDRFQYYNAELDRINEKNNYNPILSLTNKPVGTYKPIFENFILFFNEKIRIQENEHNLLNRGIFYSLTGKFNESITDLNKSIELNEKQSMAWFERANTRYKMLEQIELLAGTNNSLTVKIGEKSADSQPQFGQPAALDYKQILDDYEVVLYLNKDFYIGYFNRAFIKLRLGEYKSAIEDLNRAIAIEPEFAEAYFNRGLTKIYMNDPEGGALDLSRAGELGIYGAYNVIKRYCN